MKIFLTLLGTYQGIIVTRKPTRAQTLRLVIVLTRISIAPVKIRPIPLCTGSPFRMDWKKVMASAK
jgi:hypothetical protein